MEMSTNLSWLKVWSCWKPKQGRDERSHLSYEMLNVSHQVLEILGPHIGSMSRSVFLQVDECFCQITVPYTVKIGNMQFGDLSPILRILQDKLPLM